MGEYEVVFKVSDITLTQMQDYLVLTHRYELRYRIEMRAPDREGRTFRYSIPSPDPPSTTDSATIGHNPWQLTGSYTIPGPYQIILEDRVIALPDYITEIETGMSTVMATQRLNSLIIEDFAYTAGQMLTREILNSYAQHKGMDVKVKMPQFKQVFNKKIKFVPTHLPIFW